MDRGHNDAAGAAVAIRDLLFRAALLTGAGPRASAWADHASAAVAPAPGRSCLEAGSPVQLTVDAPGPSGLRVGVRVHSSHGLDAAEHLLTPERLTVLTRALGALLPPAKPPQDPLGTWVFASPSRASVFVDLREGSPREALHRVVPLLDSEMASRLQGHEALFDLARPWALRLEAKDRALCRVHIHWLIHRHGDPADFADRFGWKADWTRLTQVLAPLLRVRPTRVGRLGRWVFALPLDTNSPVALRAATSGWARLRDDDRKQAELGRAVAELGGSREHVEAVYHLCRSLGNGRRVGRALEVRIDDEPRLRVGLVPSVAQPAVKVRDRAQGVAQA